MDKNTWIGFLLIAAIIVGFTWISRPSKEELAERQRIQDSISVAKMAEAEAQRISEEITLQQAAAAETATPEAQEDLQERLQAAYGTFAQAAQGEEQFVTLANEHVRLTLSTLG